MIYGKPAMSYFSKIIKDSFAEAVAKVTVEVKEEGFGSDICTRRRLNGT